MVTAETLNQQNPQIETLEQFWDSAQKDLDAGVEGNFAYIDHPFSIAEKPGEQQQEVILYDALNKILRDPNGAIIERVPTVVLIDPQTSKQKEVPAEAFVQWVKNTQPSTEPLEAAGGDYDLTMPEQLPDVSSEEEVVQARQEIAKINAIEKLGLPQEAGPEEIKGALVDRVAELQNVVLTLGEFDPVRKKAIREINETLSMQVNRLSGSVRDGIASYLDSSFTELQRFHEGVVRGDKKLILPDSQTELEGFTRSVRTLRGNYDAMVQRGRNFIETDMASDVKRTLEKMARLQDQLVKELRETENLLAETSGFSSVQQMNEQSSREKQKEYRNKDVARWANELGSKSITQERAKEIEVEMHTAVRIETGMVDDPNSPRVWFNNDIIRNRNKSRHEGVQYSGRVGAEITSQQHVAELMSDMLTGKYNIAAGNSPSPIQLSRDGLRVDSGVHRAAALAMLYGNSWQEVAKRKGILIDSSKR